MGFSATADDFRSEHIKAVIVLISYHLFGNRFGETRPTATGLKFILRGEQRFAGGDIHIDARFEVIPIFIAERMFGIFVLRHAILQRG